VKDLAEAIDRTICFLMDSDDSLWAHNTIIELIELLEEHHRAITQSNNIDKQNLSLLFAPTGSLQEISMDNSWGSEFIQISAVVDMYTKS
jgi:hypothetical protein